MALANDIHIRKSGGAGRITLTRPDALNAMTYDMCLAIEQALIDWREDDTIKLVTIDAEGDRAFCAGGDIQQLYDTGRAGNFDYGRKFWADEYRLNSLIANYPKPYVAIMDGIVMGGGVGISAHGSHRIVTERTMLAMPECTIGLVPDVGGNWILSRAPGHMGEFLGTTGSRLGAADTIYAGFADAFVPAEKVHDLVSDMERSSDISTIEQYTEQVPPDKFPGLQSAVDHHFSKKTAADVIASLEGANDDWADKQAKLMRRNCPLSVASAIELVRRSRELTSIAEVLTAEYRFTWRSMSDGDFLEGIRAQIIDKDRNPKWQVSTLEALTNEQISAMLEPLGEYELIIQI